VDHFILLRYFNILYYCIVLYLFAGGYKCRLTTFPTRFAQFCAIVTTLLNAIVVPWANE